MIDFHNERAAPSVEKQPCVELTKWRVIESATGDRYILALSPEGVARVTSAVFRINPSTRSAITSSGRVYEFLHPPEVEPVIRVVLRLNAFHCGLGSAVDISDAVWTSFRSLEH